jgi:aldehyde oxidoreductase
MLEIETTVNGLPRRVIVDPNTRLLDFLRDHLGLKGTKEGCGQGHCGACAVLLGDKVVLACRTPAHQAHHQQIVTIEGLGTPDRPHPIQTAFVAAGAIQCGFCTPGMIIRTKALLDVNPSPSDNEIRKTLGPHLCRCTGYVKIVEAVHLAARLMRGEVSDEKLRPDASQGWLGISLPRPDAILKATGGAAYTADIFCKGAMHLAVVRSTRAHARIVSIDTSAAERTPGVIGTVTAADVKGTNRLDLFYPDQPLLADDVVHQIGDPVVVVAAEMENAARAGAVRVMIEYADLPAVFEPEAAREPDAPRLDPDMPNEYFVQQLLRGDADRAFRAAPFKVDTRLQTQATAHAQLEPEAALATFDDQDRLKITGRSQGIHLHARMLRQALGLAEDRLRYVQAHTGGAFGVKLDITAEGLAGAAALKFRRPARLIYSRAETFIATTKRHPLNFDLKLGAAEDGALSSVLVGMTLDTGAYTSYGHLVALRAIQHVTGPYFVSNVSARVGVVRTNNVVAGAMRGFGAPQMTFALETAVDMLVHRLGRDPLDWRIQNSLRPGHPTCTGQVIEPLTFRICLERLLPFYRRAQARAREMDRPDRRRGVGLAGFLFGVGKCLPGDHSEVLLELREDGGVNVCGGVADMGQGNGVMLTQICAQTLDLPPAMIHLCLRDSDLTPDSGTSSGTRQTFMSGGAALDACRRLNQVRDTHGVQSYRDFVDQGLPLTYTGLKTQATGYTDEKNCQGEFYETFVFGVQMAEVEVEPNTGQTRVHRITGVYDPGTIINPAALEGQIQGGVVMGLGYALTEDYVHPDTDSFATYRIPRIKDVPRIESVFLPMSRDKGPFGATGVGEIGIIGVAPAVCNAIFDACGARVTSLPATPDRIKAAMV